MSFPVNLPVFVQPGGASTGEFIVQLRQLRNSIGDGIGRELRSLIASQLNIPLESVLVIRVSAFEQATVIVCSGDFTGYFNKLNRRDPMFDGTILEAGYSQFAFYGVPCQDPSVNLPQVPAQPPVKVPDQTYSKSTFKFSPEDPKTPGSPLPLAPESRYLTRESLVVIPIDDDDFFIIRVSNNSFQVMPSFFLLVAVLLGALLL